MNPIKVLCVDDNEDILWALGVHFEHAEGIDVVGSRPSADGLFEAVQEIKPDILILDLDMEGTSPLQALRAINQSGSQTRTIIFSGHLRREFIDQAMDAGAWGYVSKNDGETSLVTAIHAIMAGEIAWSPEIQAVIAQR